MAAPARPWPSRETVAVLNAGMSFDRLDVETFAWLPLGHPISYFSAVVLADAGPCAAIQPQTTYSR